MALTAAFNFQQPSGHPPTVYGTYSAFTQVDYVPRSPAATPEPLTVALSGAGLIGLGVLRRRSRSPKPGA
jgi:hypothetical protein